MFNKMRLRSKTNHRIVSLSLALCFSTYVFCGIVYSQNGVRSATTDFEEYSRGIEFVSAQPSKKPTSRKPPKQVVNRKISGSPGLRVSVERQIGGIGDWFRLRSAEVADSSDHVRVKFKANFTGKLTIIGLGTSGKNKILFPNNQENGMKRNQEYYLPSETGWSFTGPSGSEQLVFLMSTTELPKSLLSKYLALKSDVNSDTENAELIGKDKRTDRDLEPVNENDRVYVLAKRTRLAKPVILKIVIKHK